MFGEKAAKNLYVSQPAISAAIRELEKEFNMKGYILAFVIYGLAMIAALLGTLAVVGI